MTDADNLPLSMEDNVLHNRISDRQMADKVLSAAILYRGYTVVALAGYSHTSTTQWYSLDPEWRPMGNVVAAAMPVDIIGLQSEGGEHWAAGRAGCGPRSIEAGDLSSKSARVDASVKIGRLSISRPFWQAP